MLFLLLLLLLLLAVVVMVAVVVVVSCKLPFALPTQSAVFAAAAAADDDDSANAAQSQPSLQMRRRALDPARRVVVRPGAIVAAGQQERGELLSKVALLSLDTTMGTAVKGTLSLSLSLSIV